MFHPVFFFLLRSDHSRQLRVAADQHPVVIGSVSAAGRAAAANVAATPSAEHQPHSQHIA